MKLKTRIHEVEAIFITEAFGRLKISSCTDDVNVEEIEVEVGEYLIFDQVRGIQKMAAKEVTRLYTVEGEIDVPKASKKKGTRGKKTGLGNGVTGSRTTYNSDEISTVAD